MKKSLIIALAMVVGSFAMPTISIYADGEMPSGPGGLAVDCELYPSDPLCSESDGDEDEPEEPSITDPYSENFQLSTFASAISAMLPVVGVAVLVGFLFYVIRWAIGLFRGI